MKDYKSAKEVMCSFLMQEWSPDGYIFHYMLHMAKDDAEKTISFMEGVCGIDFDKLADINENEPLDRDSLQNLLDFLVNKKVFEGYEALNRPCSSKEAFSVIYLLQEYFMAAASAFEMCSQCGSIYNAEEGGILVMAAGTEYHLCSNCAIKYEEADCSLEEYKASAETDSPLFSYKENTDLLFCRKKRKLSASADGHLQDAVSAGGGHRKGKDLILNKKIPVHTGREMAEFDTIMVFFGSGRLTA